MIGTSRVVYVSCGTKCEVGVVEDGYGDLRAYSLIMPYLPDKQFMWITSSLPDGIKQANILSDGGFVDTSDRVIYV